MQNDLNLTKATMLLVNTMGWPVVRHVTVQRSVVDGEQLVLQYVIKGKRKPVATRFSKGVSKLALYAGWHNVTEPNEFTIFEDGLLEGMKRRVNEKPVFEVA